MTVWELITKNSTLTTGTAWEHLEAQGGSEIIIVHADGMEVDMVTAELAIEIDQAPVEVTVDQAEIAVEVNQEPVEVTI